MLTDEQLTAIAAADERRHDGPMEIDGNMTVAWYEFIAVASWAIPALLREVAALRAERDEVQRVLRVAWDELTELKDDVPAAGAVRNLLLPRIDRTWKGK